MINKKLYIYDYFAMMVSKIPHLPKKNKESVHVQYKTEQKFFTDIFQYSLKNGCTVLLQQSVLWMSEISYSWKNEKTCWSLTFSHNSCGNCVVYVSHSISQYEYLSDFTCHVLSLYEWVRYKMTRGSHSYDLAELNTYHGVLKYHSIAFTHSEKCHNYRYFKTLQIFRL